MSRLAKYLLIITMVYTLTLCIASCKRITVRPVTLTIYNSEMMDRIPNVVVYYDIEIAKQPHILGIPIPVHYKYRQVFSERYLSNDIGIVEIPRHLVRLGLYETVTETIAVNLDSTHQLGTGVIFAKDCYNPVEQFRGFFLYNDMVSSWTQNKQEEIKEQHEHYDYLAKYTKIGKEREEISIGLTPH